MLPIIKSRNGRTVKYQHGKVYLYRGHILLIVITPDADDTELESALEQYLDTGVISHGGVVYG